MIEIMLNLNVLYQLWLEKAVQIENIPIGEFFPPEKTNICLIVEGHIINI